MMARAGDGGGGGRRGAGDPVRATVSGDGQVRFSLQAYHFFLVALEQRQQQRW